MRLFEPADRLEGFEQFAGFGRLGRLGLRLEIRAELLDYLGVYARMLADIQGVQVKSELA